MFADPACQTTPKPIGAPALGIPVEIDGKERADFGSRGLPATQPRLPLPKRRQGEV
jgi:hypothetical protein